MIVEVSMVTCCVVVAAVIFSVTLLKAYRSRHTVSRGLTILLAGICISSLFLFFPRYLDQSLQLIQQDGLVYPPVIRSLAYTLYYSLKSISGGHEIDVMEQLLLSSVHPVVRWLYFILNYGFLLAAPVLTSGLILSLVGDLGERFRCFIYRNSRFHVFSELNGNALALVEKIRERNPKDLIVFCNTKNVDKDLRRKAKSAGTVCLYAACTSERLHLGAEHIRFYLVSSNEDENLRDAEKLIGRYGSWSGETCIINAFAESGTGIQMVEQANKGHIGIRFVDISALLCSNLLMQYPLYHFHDGAKAASVAIVGCDKLGMRLLKTVTWCAAMEGCPLKIRVYDKNADYLQKKLEAECPELMEHCDVVFHAADARTSELETCVLHPDQGSLDATYVVLAMGDDELNIAAAERLARLFRHHNRYAWMPRILARIQNPSKMEVYTNQENSYLEGMGIHFFGGMEEIFADGVLHHSYLENLAFAVALCYSGLLPKQDPMTMSEQQLREYFAQEPVRKERSQFLQSEYARRSSMAAALHIPVKLYSCGILTADQRIPTVDNARQFQELMEKDPQLLEKLAQIEHLRWNSFMRSEGFVQATWEELMCFYPKLEKKDNKDVLGKRHLCLTKWDELDELYRKYLSLDPPEKNNFKDSDFAIVKGIPCMLLLAKRMEEVTPEELS